MLNYRMSYMALENNKARLGAHGSHGGGTEVGRWKPARVLEHASLSKAAGSLLGLVDTGCDFTRDSLGISSRESENQVEASLAK